MMEMTAEVTASVLDNLLKHGKFNVVTRNAIENAVRLLKDQPEIVRCADCEWLIEDGCGDCDMCAREGLPVSKTDFCSFAERKTDK